MPATKPTAVDTLRKARDYLGWTQPEMAAALGVHRVTLARYECGLLDIPAFIVLAVRQIRRTGRRKRA